MPLPNNPDVRSLIIGIFGGLIVAALLVLANLVRVAGFRGLLHMRRSVAALNLEIAELVGPNPFAWLFAIVTLTALYLATMFVFSALTFAAVGLITVGGLKVPPYWAGALFGTATGAVIGGSAIFVYLVVTAFLAATRHDMLLARLRRIVEGSQQSAGDLPANDAP